ncbi:MAG: BREX system P-loop protein BrxC [Desulfobacterales bacterium]|nr:BREX system P-loop protein BrxC [Desulfobacterales bacterium]MDD4071284.1 BREX system P-loop protein BrxC [Desulfobacterales bacterium]MDD4393323.1 BREX system P-loop protein BrxC [Desulfobacterales bacterium]
MSKINEILTLDLQEDIKNVIDLEDQSELEIQQEIESYIVTEGIGRHLYNFTNQFTSNIKETGVWLSGFYGSGKSYFGKMLGYTISNPVINGTPARERFIPRLKGVSDESLIENAIRNLESINSRVVFLDVAKQNTDRGLAFTLFFNLLKHLGFREDIYGYMEFDLYIDGKYDNFKNVVRELEGKEWDELKASNRLVAKIMRDVFASMGYSEADYNDTYKVYSSAINDFSASKFKTELEKYLKFKSDETLVFIFDEASEAISQKKFTLLDLEGISEALSSINSKVWTIAIAQEKLDDVINNANVNRSQLTKVTDRFKTKIHLESTEVDIIIRSRLLQKKDTYFKQLLDYYKKNEGLVSDATNLKSSYPTKTTSAEEFAIYYPFHKYQFDILQKFLFSSNALVATQIAARGMIITIFDVLRKQMRDQDLFAFTPGHAICTEAQTAPPVGLVNKYDTARKILNENKSEVDGEKLLKTIHLLADSAVVSPTAENITKSYITDIKKYYDIKPNIEKVLHLLVEAKVLLLSKNNYKITSDLEGKLLEEMKEFDVELFSKKRLLINYVKTYKLLTPVATFNNGSDTFKFSVLSDQDDELCSPGSKQLKLIVYSLFNISENRQDFVEQIKLETQSDKDLITLIPDNREFSQIDKLIGEIRRYAYMEEKYSNESDPSKRQIIRDFSTIREEKEKDLRIKIENAYRTSTLIYMFDEYLLNSDTYKGTINEIQRKLIKNIYTKRLAAQLSEGLAPKIFSNRKENLSRLFSGDDFCFFDTHGNFTGDHLKVVEEINARIKSRYVDGRSLESDVSGPPWGYAFGTIVSTLAALFRAGRLAVKYNGETWFSHDQKAVHEAFINATKFKSASFKSITATLTADQKNRAVQLLMDLDIENHTGRKVDWNINDFDLADEISVKATHFIEALKALNNTVDHFESLFPNVVAQKATLQEYAGKVTENNYIEKVEHLLATGDTFRSTIQTIIKTQKFIKKNLPKAKEFKCFIEDVVAELKKSDRSDDSIQDAYDEFLRLYKQDMVKNFAQLLQQAQVVKDTYFRLIKTAASGMTYEYQLLQGKVDGAVRNLKQNYPAEFNAQNLKNLEVLKRYCSSRILGEPNLEFSITCKSCGYSLSDILNYTALAPAKDNELLIIQSSFLAEAPPQLETIADPLDKQATPKRPRKIKMIVPCKIMTVKEYKTLLTEQLTALAAARPSEEIELDIEVE